MQSNQTRRSLPLSKCVISKPPVQRSLSLSNCVLICDCICLLCKWTHGAHPWLQSTGTWQGAIRETTNNVQCGWLMLGCDVRIDFGINLWERFTFRLTAIDSSDCPRLAASIPSQQGCYSRGELYFSHGCWRHAPISSLTQKVAPSDKVEDFLFWKIPSNVTKMRMINLHWSSKGWWCNFKACYWRFLIITDLLEIIVLDIVAFPLYFQY